MAAQQTHSVHTTQAFPHHLPSAPPSMPDWSHTVEIGRSEILIVDVNFHKGQRPLQPSWVKDLMMKFAEGMQPHANVGVAILNTPKSELLPMNNNNNNPIL
jgi:hypothetical protein